jgi:hypothetical protein
MWEPAIHSGEAAGQYKLNLNQDEGNHREPEKRWADKEESPKGESRRPIHARLVA